MSAAILPFKLGSQEPSGKDYLAARRAFREDCKVLASIAGAKAFSESAKLAGAKTLGIDDAAHVFVAAMRRELRRSGLF